MKKYVKQIWSAVGLVAVASIAHAQSGSLTAFTGSTLIDESVSNSSQVYDFITGPADKIKRDVVIEYSVRVKGVVRRSTYSLGSDVNRKEVFNHYQDQLQELGAETIFTCEGPDCGRPTAWASEIFKRRDLSAPIRNQSYSASVVTSDDSQSLFSIYVVTRGNLRVMVHVEEATLDEPISFDSTQTLRDELVRRGVVTLKDVAPSRSGALTTRDLTAITDIVGESSLLSTQEIYVVCHIHGSQSTQSLIEASTKCAETVASAITESTPYQASALGTGPLIPLDDRPLTRIELVIPSLLRRE